MGNYQLRFVSDSKPKKRVVHSHKRADNTEYVSTKYILTTTKPWKFLNIGFPLPIRLLKGGKINLELTMQFSSEIIFCRTVSYFYDWLKE